MDGDAVTVGVAQFVLTRGIPRYLLYCIYSVAVGSLSLERVAKRVET